MRVAHSGPIKSEIWDKAGQPIGDLSGPFGPFQLAVQRYMDAELKKPGRLMEGDAVGQKVWQV